MPGNLQRWRDLELAKHRLFYSLLRWRLPLRTRAEDLEHGLIFNFLADTPANKILTGHDNGVITIAFAETDDIERERRRLEMGEPYRTLLGHFRHEVGHYFWDVLVRDGGQLEPCRALFGDDSADYETALRLHYKEGPPLDWQQQYVSAYATVHPWEDFAETWAHYLHIVDTLEMAAYFGMQVRPTIDKVGGLTARINFDPYAVADFQILIDAWLPFVFAMNSVSRAIGSRDMYPFILAPPVIEKLAFIHGRFRACPGGQSTLPYRRRRRMPGPTEEEIRIRAYYLWLSAGEPQGNADVFWEEAEHQLLREASDQGEVPPGMTDNLPV